MTRHANRPRVRVGVALLASALVHAAVSGAGLAVLTWERGAPAGNARRSHDAEPTDPAAAPVKVGTRERESLKAAVTRGELSLGEAWLTLEARERGETHASEAELDRYRDVLRVVRERVRDAGDPVPDAIVRTLREQKLDLHRRLHTGLGPALRAGGGNCTARTRLITALVHDLGHPDQAAARVFENHLAPVFAPAGGEHRFGMVADCTGPGHRVPALSLLDAKLPTSRDQCRDDGALLGAPLRNDDPRPSWTGVAETVEQHCPLALWPWREAGHAVHLVRHDRVGAAPTGSTVTMLAPTREDLLDYAAGLSCHQRWLSAPDGRDLPPAGRLPFLAKAVGYRREAALVFAAAGELPLTRAVEARQREALLEAHQLVARINWDETPVQFDFWSLIYLGPPGHRAMFRLAAHDNSWFTSNLVGVLVVEPVTRRRALRLLRTLPRPQQFEVAERVDWDEPALGAQFTREREGHHVSQLRRAARATRARWAGCEIDELSRIADEQIRASLLPPEYAQALVAFLVESPVLHLDRHRCDTRRFGTQVHRWRASQGAEVQRWLDRGSRVASGTLP